MAIDYPTRPVVGVGVVVWRDDTVLIVRRGHPPRLGEWSLPGGSQEIGESVAEAALREVREETGLSVQLIGLVDVVDSIIRDSSGRLEHHYTLVDFAARWITGAPRPGDDVTDVRWVRADDADQFVSWKETLRVIDQSKDLL